MTPQSHRTQREILRRSIPAAIDITDVGEVLRVRVRQGTSEALRVPFLHAHLKSVIARVTVVGAQRDVGDERIQSEQGSSRTLRTGSRKRLIDVDVADQMIAASAYIGY